MQDFILDSLNVPVDGTCLMNTQLPVPSKLPMARDGPSCRTCRSDYVVYVVSLGGVVSSFVRCQVCAQEFHRFAQQVGRLGEKDS